MVGDITHWIVHSHIADHPLRMHTRDQALGTFADIDQLPTGPFATISRLLMDRAAHFAKHPDKLLFTNTVALNDPAQISS